ncbi:PASTA domain protein [compost metagenome]
MNFNLAKSGAGNLVINQSPKAGERVERGSTIRIYMGSEGDAEGEHADHEHE